MLAADYPVTGRRTSTSSTSYTNNQQQGTVSRGEGTYRGHGRSTRRHRRRSEHEQRSGREGGEELHRASGRGIDGRGQLQCLRPGAPPTIYPPRWRVWSGVVPRARRIFFGWPWCAARKRSGACISIAPAPLLARCLGVPSRWVPPLRLFWPAPKRRSGAQIECVRCVTRAWAYQHRCARCARGCAVCSCRTRRRAGGRGTRGTAGG